MGRPTSALMAPYTREVTSSLVRRRLAEAASAAADADADADPAVAAAAAGSCCCSVGPVAPAPAAARRCSPLRFPASRSPNSGAAAAVCGTPSTESRGSSSDAADEKEAGAANPVVVVAGA